MPNATIDRDELRKELADGALILIDVLPKEYYGECHVAGACNACVHEVTFLDQVKAITADKDAAIVVYGSSGRSRDAAVAAEKLAEAGYRNVRAFTGGLHEWRAAGLPVNEAPEQAVPAPTLRDGTYRADPAKSMLHWTGRNINGRHHGTIAVASGELTMSGGTPVTGQVVVDMTAIVDVDLADSALNRLLVAHLQSDDFFDTARHPTATFDLTGAEPLTDATPGTPNYRITGALTIRGTSHPVACPALIAPRQDGGVTAQACLDLDRTRWNVNYGSGKFFEKLGMHLVNDLISVELHLVGY